MCPAQQKQTKKIVIKKNISHKSEIANKGLLSERRENVSPSFHSEQSSSSGTSNAGDRSKCE